MSDLVSVSDAAKALEVNKSSVSRYLKRYPELNRGVVGRPLVDVEDLRRHRDENVNLEAPPPPAPPPDEPSRKHSLTEVRTDTEWEKLRKHRLENAERFGKTCPKDEVFEGMAEGAQLIRERLQHRNRDLADTLAGLTDPRAVTTALEAADRELLSWLAEEWDRRVKDIEGEGHERAA